LGFGKFLSAQLMKIRFVRNAVSEKADLSVFKQKPTPKMICGFVCMAVSYIICWPVISLLGVFSIYHKKPLLLIIGGAVIWNIANLLFMLGVYLAGARHSKEFLKWATRMLIEKLES